MIKPLRWTDLQRLHPPFQAMTWSQLLALHGDKKGRPDVPAGLKSGGIQEDAHNATPARRPVTNSARARTAADG